MMKELERFLLFMRPAANPSSFRGHHWGCIGILIQACDKYFAVPLWANIQEGLTLLANSDEKRHLPKTIQIVEMAQRVAMAMKSEAYLVKREDKAREYSQNYKKLLEIVEEMTIINMTLLKENACL